MQSRSVSVKSSATTRSNSSPPEMLRQNKQNHRFNWVSTGALTRGTLSEINYFFFKRRKDDHLLIGDALNNNESTSIGTRLSIDWNFISCFQHRLRTGQNRYGKQKKSWPKLALAHRKNILSVSVTRVVLAPMQMAEAVPGNLIFVEGKVQNSCRRCSNVSWPHRHLFSFAKFRPPADFYRASKLNGL